MFISLNMQFTGWSCPEVNSVVVTTCVQYSQVQCREYLAWVETSVVLSAGGEEDVACVRSVHWRCSYLMKVLLCAWRLAIWNTSPCPSTRHCKWQTVPWRRTPPPPPQVLMTSWCHLSQGRKYVLKCVDFKEIWQTKCYLLLHIKVKPSLYTLNGEHHVVFILINK